MFVNNHLYILGLHISERNWCYNAIPSGHCFYVKTKILVDFQICISVPLTLLLFAISFNSFNVRFIIIMLDKKTIFFIIACFGCKESDQICYYSFSPLFRTCPRLRLLTKFLIGFLDGCFWLFWCWSRNASSTWRSRFSVEFHLNGLITLSHWCGTSVLKFESWQSLLSYR